MIRPEIVNFFCIGAQKAGTTTIFNLIKQHPDIYIPKEKEAHFFDINERYNLGINWYMNNFYSKYSNQKIVGTITPEYLYLPYVANRLYKTFGNLKLLIILRNPVDRAYSHYLMSKRRGVEKSTFEDAIKKEKNRIELNYRSLINHSYISRGYYLRQIKEYEKYFDKKNIKIFIFEKHIINNVESTVSEIFDFLEIEDISDKINYDVTRNEARKSKYTFLNELLNKNYGIIKLLSKYIKINNTIRVLKYNIREFNENIGEPIKDKKLTNKKRKYLYEKYFKSSVGELEKHLQMDLSVWND